MLLPFRGPGRMDFGRHCKKKISECRIDRGEVFESVTEAARQTGAERANIRLCINGKINTSMGRKWFYLKPTEN